MGAGSSNQHGSNAQAHHEQATAAVQEIEAVPDLLAVRVQDPDGDDGDKAVEQVELRGLELLPGDQADTEANLHKDGDLDTRGNPPQRSRAQPWQPVGAERPHTCQTVADDDNPRPTGVDVKQGRDQRKRLERPRQALRFSAAMAATAAASAEA